MHLATLLAPLTLLSTTVRADFLDFSEDDTYRVHSSNLNAMNTVTVSDFLEPWPMDLPPWDFAEQLVYKLCSEKGRYHANVQIPATMMYEEDTAPRWVNVSVTLEGRFSPGDPRRSRQRLTWKLKELLRLMWEPFEGEYLKYHGFDPATNQTSLQYRPLYMAPRTAGVTYGHRPGHARSFVSIKMDSQTPRRNAGPRERRAYLYQRIESFERRLWLSSFWGRVAIVECLSRKQTNEAIEGRRYYSKQFEILEAREKRKYSQH